MSLNITVEVSKICAQVDSFGDVLDGIRQRRQLRQDQLATLISRSPAEVSRLINNKLPKYLTVTEVHRITRLLNCTREEMVLLINAFVCHLLYHHEVIDLDVM
jgi:plasmid maintenance system antidote protein VapI